MSNKEELKTLKDVQDFRVDMDRPLHSATHEEILSGKTTDV